MAPLNILHQKKIFLQEISLLNMAKHTREVCSEKTIRGEYLTTY